jgi:hypothetical protein
MSVIPYRLVFWTDLVLSESWTFHKDICVTVRSVATVLWVNLGKTSSRIRKCLLTCLVTDERVLTDCVVQNVHGTFQANSCCY